ncbi:MAG: hypothetical protein N4A33_01245, partial [Bacteriovoracaceae bacterium]|nr:hypothetical protein [Bacteriovoracaceae bacterium]
MKILNLKLLFTFVFVFLTACSGGNQSAIDDFFNIGGEDESDSGAISFSAAEFREAIANDGTIDTVITARIEGRKFEGAAGEEFVGSKLIVTNMPPGLSISAQYLNKKELSLTVSGTAAAHANIDDVSNVTFDFADNAFNLADNIAGKQSLLAVNFRDPYALSYDKAIINESGENDGSVIESFNVSVNDLNFDGNIGEDF